MHPLNHDSVWSLSHISHTEFHLNQFTEQSVHIPGNKSTCITWSWEKIVSWESDGGSWMGIMRKSKILVAGSMWEYTTRPKHDNCTYVLKRWLGGEEIILNFSFVKNFFISLPLKFWNGNISLSCVWSFPPLPPPLSDKSDQNSTFLCCTWQSKRNLWLRKPQVFKQQRIVLQAPLSGDLWQSSCRERLAVFCVLSVCVRWYVLVLCGAV